MDEDDVCCKPKISPRSLFLTPPKKMQTRFPPEILLRNLPWGSTNVRDPGGEDHWEYLENKDFTGLLIGVISVDLKVFKFHSFLSLQKMRFLCIHILIEFHIITKFTGNICRKYGKGGIWGALRMWTPDMSWALHGRRCGLSGSQWSCYLGIACAWKMFTFLYKCLVLWHGQLVFLSSFLCLKILDFKPYLFSTSTFDTAKPLFPTGAGPAHKQVWNPGSHRSCVCEGS